MLYYSRENPILFLVEDKRVFFWRIPDPDYYQDSDPHWIQICYEIMRF
jgi:hypothetical protein